ncbi:MAG TPA: ELWxxDGT repeat protein, partial [Chryseosolibacter sp.]|nr:ELWxxDGT repeat protein [Chryseosolibacter sp.]
MKTKINLENSSIPFSTIDWKLPTLCLTLVMTLQGYSQTQLVKDINTQIGHGLVQDTEYTNFVVAGANLYYVLYGNQLWRTATAGTSASFVKEIEGISNLINVNGRLFFTAVTDNTGVELWKSDGTAASTVIVKDIRAGVDSSSPSLLTNVGGTLFFAANDGLKGVELWKSDGSITGTLRVKDIANGSSYPSNLIASNGLLYFSAHDGQNGYEMWKSNGTSAGTVMIKDLRAGYKVGSNPQQFIALGDMVFFTALTPAGERRLHKTDGTTAGTTLVSNAPNHVKFMTDVNGTLFFAATDAAHGEELWKSDGTPEGTLVVKDITPGPRSENSYGIPHLEYFRSMGDKLYFFAHDDYGQRLWVSDGTENGTIALVGHPDVSFTWLNANPIVFRGEIYFNGDLEGGGNLSLIRTDGSSAGQEIFIHDVGYYSDDQAARVVANNFLYFMSYGNLWKTDGTNKSLVRSPFTSTQSSDPEEITDVKGIVYFGAFDGKSHGLWKSDGTKAGTTLVKRFAAPVKYLTSSGNYLYYLAKAVSATSPTYQKLWRTELTTGGTRMLSNINSDGDDAIGELADADGVLYFSAITENGQVQLWKTEGERANTVLVKNFNNTGVPIIHLTTIGKHVFFSTASQSRPNDALWKSDGTSANTNIIKVFNTIASTRRAITEMIRVNQKIFYIAYDGYDYEIWKTNGSGSGTIRLKDIQSDDE